MRSRSILLLLVSLLLASCAGLPGNQATVPTPSVEITPGPPPIAATERIGRNTPPSPFPAAPTPPRPPASTASTTNNAPLPPCPPAGRGDPAPTATICVPTAPKIASYQLNARLDPQAKTVTGTGKIFYTNPSQDTLSDVYLRLYLKAFSTTESVWMRESGGQLRGDKMDPTRLGNIEISRLTLPDGTNLLNTATLSDTLLRVPLPTPLGPGERLEIDTAWVSTLPRVFARTGYGGRDDTFFMVAQWYPKMAVYDRGRWDTQPWHANSEFFNDFGDYDVTIDVPQNYVVAGAGVPLAEARQADDRSITVFRSENVTDYAFAASPDFRIASAKAGPTDIVLYYMPEHADSVQEYLSTGTGSISTLGAWFGAYPHPRLTIVDVPENAEGAGGMEYPTLITGGTGGVPGGSGAVALVTAHEIGHQWWPMQTATNEGAEPWLDEGLTQYSGNRYLQEIGAKIGFRNVSLTPLEFERMFYTSAPKNRAVNDPAWTYGGDYGTIVYAKTSLGLWTLENTVGSERFRQAMAAYLAEWRFRHPTGADFRASIERELGPQPWFFDQFVKGGTIDYGVSGISSTPNGETVTILREGNVAVPVEIRLTHADGRQQTQVWDGQATQWQLNVPANDPLARVEIDPARKLAAELDIKDNGRSVRPETGALFGIGSKLVLTFQSIAQTVGLFG